MNLPKIENNIEIPKCKKPREFTKEVISIRSFVLAGLKINNNCDVLHALKAVIEFTDKLKIVERDPK